jgi:hypothetical protein
MPPAECIVIIDYPLPSGVLLGSFVDQSVSLDLNSAGVTLRPGWEYSYSVAAKSAAGTATSHEQRFKTPEDGVQPLNTTPPLGGAPNAGQGTAASAANQSPVTPSPKVTALTSAQKLSKALKACKRRPKRQRASCAKQAHRTYTTAAKKR